MRTMPLAHADLSAARRSKSVDAPAQFTSPECGLIWKTSLCASRDDCRYIFEFVQLLGQLYAAQMPFHQWAFSWCHASPSVPSPVRRGKVGLRHVSTLPPKQLTMVIDEATVSRLLDVRTAARLRDSSPCRPDRIRQVGPTRFRRGDSTCWTEETGPGVSWRDAERREGSRVVEQGGRIVAGTFASRIPKRPPMTQCRRRGSFRRRRVLDYVVTHPDHQGRGLGRATCAEVSRFLHRPGVQDGLAGHRRLEAAGNPRLPCRMGYRPVMNRNDMSARWAAVYEKLKESGRDYS